MDDRVGTKIDRIKLAEHQKDAERALKLATAAAEEGNRADRASGETANTPKGN